MDVRITLVKPHSGQRDLEQAWHGGKRYVSLRCGRRFGKTTWMDAKAIETAINGGAVGWFTPNTDYADPVWYAWRKLFPDAMIENRDEKARTLRLRGGGILEMWTLHNNDDPGRSRKYHLACVDEAGLIPRLATIWKTAIQPTLWDYNGRGLLAGTPKGRRTDFNVMHDQAALGDDPEWIAFQKGSADNPYIPREEIEAFRRQCERDGTMWMYEQEALGIPADDGSNPIGLQAIARAQTAASTERVAAVGIDLARKADYTVIFAADAFGTWRYVDRWTGQPWSLTKRKIAAYLNEHATDPSTGLLVPVCVDATGVGDPVVGDLHTMGLEVQGVVFTPSSRRQMLERVVTDMQGGRVRIPPKDGEHGWLAKELETLGVETLPGGGTRYGVPSGLHDDGIMALALCLKALRGVDVPTWDMTPRHEDQHVPHYVRGREREREALDGPYHVTIDWREPFHGRDGQQWEDADRL